MRFSGRVYFDFVAPAVWRFYRFLTVAAAEGATLQLDWRPFQQQGAAGRDGEEALFAYAWIREHDQAASATYLQALLTAYHRNGAEADIIATAESAARVAGIDAAGWREAVSGAHGANAVARATEEGRGLGVSRVPSLYRHGPVLHVDLTPAALDPGALRRLELIDGVLEDDAIWTLSKP